MKDFLGKELKIGDTVVFIASKYRMLVKGVITSFTPQKVYVEFTNTWNYSSNPPTMRILQDSTQLVKVE